ncbi:MAG: OmpH family outer membrane protein [Bacteroidaceae bacterium]|nr:OmpH family outer membrane protein [Bacteroidaceae bacterium]MBR7051492.1 OmpH family outer membrane protein [Bacteroidaceae bacterium]
MKHVILFAVAAALSLTACQKSAEEAEETAQSEGAETTGLKIAYVEMDSLITQYQLYKDYEEELTRKGTNIQSTLAQKQRTLEQHAAAMQKKYESNGFTTRDELERAQNSIQAEQQQLQELADRLQTDFAQEQARVNQEARDSIQAFLRSYNKTKKYDYVLVKAGDNMLIANPKMDITKEVIKGLNKRYKKSRKTAE